MAIIPHVTYAICSLYSIVRCLQETRARLRLLLLQVFGSLCALDAAFISELLNSVLPLELARDLQTDTSGTLAPRATQRGVRARHNISTCMHSLIRIVSSVQLLIVLFEMLVMITFSS